MGHDLTVTGWFRAENLQGGGGWKNLFWKGDAPEHMPDNIREYSLQLNQSGFVKIEATPGPKRKGISDGADCGRCGQRR